jgi:hypothetical protein
MATILVFEHEGWEVATSSWSAAAKPGKGVTVCYEWGADRISWFDNAVSTARITLNMTMGEFLSVIQGKALVDFRPRRK